MVSISTLKWSTPRPNTMNESADCPGSTRKARFFSNSRSKRSLIWREVTYLPSRPKNGESLMVNNILMVGSSIAMGSSASGFSKSAIVSPISNPSIPTSAQISPHCTSSTFCFPIPSKVIKSLIRVLTNVTPSLLQRVTGIPDFNVPRVSLPMAIRPT